MKVKELSKETGIDPKVIRKIARKLFNKQEEGWNFTEDQVNQLKDHFKTAASTASTVAAKVPAASDLVSDYRTEAGLTEIARSWLKETYGLELKIPVEINTRISRALGRFIYLKKSKEPLRIEIGSKTLQYYTKEEVLDTLYHELVHYACFILGKPHSDGDWYFEAELKRLGIGSTGTTQHKGVVNIYSCNSCGKKIQTRRKLRKLGRYSSKCCSADLTYKGTKEIN